MAAPSAGVRLAASGQMLGDGTPVTIAIGLDLDIEFQEEEVTPPSLKMMSPIDATSQQNVRYTTKSSPQLIEIGNASGTVFYDPMVLNSIKAILGVNTTITIRFPNDDTWAFYGYLESFEPGSVKRGDKVKATISIVATNMDLACQEFGPVFAAGTGTAC